MSNFWGTVGAGIMFFTGTLKNPKVLLLKRSEFVNEPHTWGNPGGKVDSDDAHLLEAAIRECREELGGIPDDWRVMGTVEFKSNGFNFKYTTFLVHVEPEIVAKWNIVLNWESSDYNWFSLNELPSPLHFGAKFVFDEIAKRY